LKHLPKKNFDEISIKEIVQSYLQENCDAKILKKKKMIKRVYLFIYNYCSDKNSLLIDKTFKK